MKRRILSALLLALLALSLSACARRERVIHMGVDGEILQIDGEHARLTLRGIGRDSILGEQCEVLCSPPDTYYIYCDNATGDLRELSFADFAVGDRVSIDVEQVVDGRTKTPRVQLLTQRL